MAKITGTWAFSTGQEELQTRLKKLHEQRDLIVNLLDHMIDRMNVLVNRTAAITNISQFLRHFCDTAGTMERLFQKLFQVHVLLTEEDYIDASMCGPQMSIAYSIHEDKTRNTTSSLAFFTTNGDFQCLRPSSAPGDPLPLQGSDSEVSSRHSEPTAVPPSPLTLVASNTIVPVDFVATCAATTCVSSSQVAHFPLTPTLTTTTVPLVSTAVMSAERPSVTPTVTVATSMATSEEADLTVEGPSESARVSPLGEQKLKVVDAGKSAPSHPRQDALPMKIDENAVLHQGAGDVAAESQDKGATEEEARGLQAQHVSLPRAPRTLPKYGARPSGSTHEAATSPSTSKWTAPKPPPEGVSVPTTNASPLVIPPPVVQAVGRPIDVVLSCYKSPSEFWLQQKSSSDTLQMLLDSLHGLYSGKAPDPNYEIKVGMYCAAYYAADTYWYRAKVLQVQQGHVKVSYVDFGNCERVEKHYIHPLDPSLAAVPAQAMCCSIRGIKPIGGQVMWDHQAVQTFQQKLNGDVSLRAIFYEHDPIKCRYSVEILVDTDSSGDRVTLDVAEHFVSLRLAEEVDCPDDMDLPCNTAPSQSLPLKAPPQAPVLSAHVPPPVLPEGDFFVTLSVVFSPSDFYGQVMDDVAKQQELERLQQRLNEYGPLSRPPAHSQVVPGSHWVCLYSGDEHWYRVRVLDVVQEPMQVKFKVFYVDYGNRGTVTAAELRPLTPALAELPAFAHHLELSFVAPIGDRWDEKAKRLFVEKTGFDDPLYAEQKHQRKDALGVVTEVVLWSQKGPRTGINLNVVLVEHGVATMKPESTLP